MTDTNDEKNGESSDGEAAQEATGEAARPDGAPKRRRRRRKRGPRDERPPAPMDDRTERALEFVLRVLDDMEIDCDAELGAVREDDPNEIRVEITGADSSRVIGKKGQVLSAIQYLVNRVANRPGEERRYVTVDAEGYRSRRDDSLAAMAQKLGTQAVEQGKIITFEPMNPRDRRVIHLALAKFDGVMTKSEGEGEDRRVQIIPVRR